MVGCSDRRRDERVRAVAVPEYIGSAAGYHPEVADPRREQVDGVEGRETLKTALLALGAPRGRILQLLEVALVLELLLEGGELRREAGVDTLLGLLVEALEHADERLRRVDALAVLQRHRRARVAQVLLPVARPLRVLGEAGGVLDRAVRQPRERPALRSLEAEGGDEVRLHLRVAQGTELDQLAAGHDRRHDALEPVGDQQEDHVGGRLLEALEQRVGGRVVQELDVGDDEHAVRRREGAQHEVGHDLVHLLLADDVALALDEVQVGVRAAAGTLALRARTAAAARGDDGHAQLSREGRFAEPLRAGQQVRVAEGVVVHGALEEILDTLLPGDEVEHGRSAPQTEPGGGDGLEGRRLHVGRHEPDVAEAVDEAHALGVPAGDDGEAGGHPPLQFEPFGLDAVRRTAGAGEADHGVYVDHEREVGHEPAQARLVDGQHLVDAKAPGEALVGEGRVDEAVEHEHAAVRQRRQEHAVDELGAGGRVQERLGPRRQLGRAVQQEVAHRLAGRGTAGLADDGAGCSDGADRQPAGGEALAEQRRLRALAAAVAAFEGDQHARESVHVSPCAT